MKRNNFTTRNSASDQLSLVPEKVCWSRESKDDEEGESQPSFNQHCSKVTPQLLNAVRKQAVRRMAEQVWRWSEKPNSMEKKYNRCKIYQTKNNKNYFSW